MFWSTCAVKRSTNTLDSLGPLGNELTQVIIDRTSSCFDISPAENQLLTFFSWLFYSGNFSRIGAPCMLSRSAGARHMLPDIDGGLAGRRSQGVFVRGKTDSPILVSLNSVAAVFFFGFGRVFFVVVFFRGTCLLLLGIFFLGKENHHHQQHELFCSTSSSPCPPTGSVCRCIHARGAPRASWRKIWAPRALRSPTSPAIRRRLLGPCRPSAPSWLRRGPCRSGRSAPSCRSSWRVRR